MKIIDLTPEEISAKEKTLYTEDNLRLHLISKLVFPESREEDSLYFTSLPLKEGIGIEYCYNGQHYIVLCFVKFDSKENFIIEEIENRAKEYIKLSRHNKRLYKKFVKLAKKTLKESLKNGL